MDAESTNNSQEHESDIPNNTISPDNIQNEKPKKTVRRRRTKPAATTVVVNEDDSIPEKISIDFDDADASEQQQNMNGYRTQSEEWTPTRSSTCSTDSFGQKNSPETCARNTKQTCQEQQTKQYNRQQNDRGIREWKQQPSAINNQNNNNMRRQPNNIGNRQKFARTVRIGQLSSGYIKSLECMESFDKMQSFCKSNIDESLPAFDFNVAYETRSKLVASDIIDDDALMEEFGKSNHKILEYILIKKCAEKTPIIAHGVVETIEGGDALLVYANDNYRIRPQSAFIPRFFVQKYGLRRGQDVVAYLHPQAENSTCPFVMKILSVLGMDPETVYHLPKFKDLTPFYPTERLFLECSKETKWDNVSMRIVDILTPIGLGQRGLIVAPPRTGKTVLLQSIANAISTNRPDVVLIILLIDERPEEVTDCRRQVPNAEIISSTFDESPDNHIHAADMVIDKARRQVEAGKHVVILLDSITRLARAHNTEQPSSGKLLSGGVDANALQSPKKFFGAARNIEGGGSLTILATALVETGSRMDEVIFEEFKGTGNMELHLDRSLIDKRIFPAINIEKSGTRKEELLYHPDEMEKVYTLRRAIKGVPVSESMEMLVQRMKSTKSNTEFLLNINR